MGFMIPALAAQVVGSGIQAYGQLKSANAQSAAAKYNAAVSSENAAVAQSDAAIAGQAGSAQAGESSFKTRAQVGALTANTAAGNIDVNQGSAVDTKESEQVLGEYDALNIRSAATRQAFSYQTQATNEKAESALQTYEAGQDIEAGQIGAAGTLIGSAGNAGTQWAKYSQGGGFTG